MIRVAFLFLETIARLMPEALARALVGAIADLLWLTRPSIRRRITANIARAGRGTATGRALRHVARRSWRGLVTNYYELLQVSTWDPSQLRDRLRLEGIEHVENALAGGRGVIVLFVHAGAFEALSALASLHPHWRLLTLVEHMHDARAHELMERMRTTRGLAVVPVDRLRVAVRRVVDGSVMLIGADRDMTHSGVLVSFFGTPARLPDGGVQLALRFQVPLLLAHAVRGPGVHPIYQAHVRPVEITRTGDRRADTVRAVQTIARALEGIVAAHPDQWVTNYDFWPNP